MHVDIALNEWLAARQARVGRVTIEVTERFAVSAMPKAMLDLLAKTFDGDYVVVTSPHEDANCPFAESDTVPMVVFSTKTGLPPCD